MPDYERELQSHMDQKEVYSSGMNLEDAQKIEAKILAH